MTDEMWDVRFLVGVSLTPGIRSRAWAAKGWPGPQDTRGLALPGAGYLQAVGSPSAVCLNLPDLTLYPSSVGKVHDIILRKDFGARKVRKTLESPLDSREIKSGKSKGNQP